MLARISRFNGKPDQIDIGIKQYLAETLPFITKAAGNKGAYLLVDRKSGKTMGITLWENEKALLASAATADRLRNQGSNAIGASKPPVVEIYEVAHHS